jgi:hypothetical protein
MPKEPTSSLLYHYYYYYYYYYHGTRLRWQYYVQRTALIGDRLEVK